MSVAESNPRSRFREVTDHMVTVLAILATVVVVAPLAAVFVYLLYKGVSSLNLAFFTQLPKFPGEAGGGRIQGYFCRVRSCNPGTRVCESIRVTG